MQARSLLGNRQRVVFAPPPGGGTPTTLRFSRRAGETVRGAAYARAIEGPRRPPAPGAASWAFAVVAVLVAIGLLWV